MRSSGLNGTAKAKSCASLWTTPRGGTIEEIIAAYFGVPQYGRDIADEVHAIDALIEQGDADAARKAMSKMRERYGNLPIFSQLEFRMRILGL